MCPYQVVRNARFSENLSCFVFFKHPFWFLPYCQRTIFAKKALSQIFDLWLLPSIFPCLERIQRFLRFKKLTNQRIANQFNPFATNQFTIHYKIMVLTGKFIFGILSLLLRNGRRCFFEENTDPKYEKIPDVVNPFHAFLFPLETSGNPWFCDVFMRYRKNSVTWNGLTRLKSSEIYLCNGIICWP